MNIIRPARYWWAEKTVGDIPVRYGVKMGQQRLIERLHRQRIGKVYALLPGGCKREELPEFRIDLTKRGEIVAAGRGCNPGFWADIAFSFKQRRKIPA